MSKILVTLFVVMVVMAMLPIPAFAALGKDCTYDKVKWEDNPISKFLYIQNWGKTPLTAMSRLAGLGYPDVLTKDCNRTGSCSAKRITGCDDAGPCYGGCAATGSNSTGACLEGESCKTCLSPGVCGFCWGISLAFANKSWGDGPMPAGPRFDKHPNHLVGDWGVTACPHPECVAGKYCLPDNLSKAPAVTATATTPAR